MPPHVGEPAERAHVTGQELLVDGEGAGVDVADRVHQADHPAGPAQVEAGEGVAVAGQMEERVAGEHVLAVGQQPLIEDALLIGGRMELVPYVGAAARRPQPGQPELGPVAVGQRLELIELGDVVTGDHHRQLEAREACRRQAVHGGGGRGVGAGPAHGVVDVGSGTVEGDLHIDVVAGRQTLRPPRR